MGTETPTSDEAMPMDTESSESSNVADVPPPELRFRLAQVTPVMGPTSGGVGKKNSHIPFREKRFFRKKCLEDCAEKISSLLQLQVQIDFELIFLETPPIGN